MSYKLRSGLIVIGFLGLAMGIASCGAKEQPAEGVDKTDKAINPNGDSELALLMREMFDEGDRVKQQIINGQIPTGLKKFETIHTAVPTDKDASGPVFESFASSYIEAVKALEASDSASVFRFNRMVDQCMNCHTEFCPGPKRRIEKLYISEG